MTLARKLDAIDANARKAFAAWVQDNQERGTALATDEIEAVLVWAAQSACVEIAEGASAGDVLAATRVNRAVTEACAKVAAIEAANAERWAQIRDSALAMAGSIAKNALVLLADAAVTGLLHSMQS